MSIQRDWGEGFWKILFIVLHCLTAQLECLLFTSYTALPNTNTLPTQFSFEVTFIILKSTYTNQYRILIKIVKILTAWTYERVFNAK